MTMLVPPGWPLLVKGEAPSTARLVPLLMKSKLFSV
jgi:hypothetical protein